MKNLTDSEVDAKNTANVVLSITFSVLSLFGTVFIVASYHTWKDVRTTSRRILVYISIADFFTAVGTIMGLWSDKKIVCLVQSIIGTFSVLCSFFWTIFMALFLYIGITRRNPRLAERVVWMFHLIGWGVPFVIVCVAASGKKLGNNGDLVSSGWCWVSVDLPWNDQVEWMLIAGKFWEVAAFVIISVLYILVKKSMRQDLKSQDEKLLSQRTTVAAQKAERKLMFIPLAFVLLRIWGTIRFFIFIHAGPNGNPLDHTWLLILQGIGDSSQGFANFCIFCFFTEKVLNQIKNCCSSCCVKICPGIMAGFRGKQQRSDTAYPKIFAPGSITEYQSMYTSAGIDNPAAIIVHEKENTENKGSIQ